MAAPRISVSTAEGIALDHYTSIVDAGSVPLGMSEFITLLIANTGDSELTFSPPSITEPNSDAFSILQMAPNTLAPGQQGYVRVRFRPNDHLSYSGTLNLFSNDPNVSAFQISLYGLGLMEDQSVSVFFDPLYVDTANEAVVIASTLVSLGYRVRTFGGIAASTWQQEFAASSVVVIPKLERNSFTPPPETRAVINASLTGPKSLIVHGSAGSNESTFLNGLKRWILNDGGQLSTGILTKNIATVDYPNSPLYLTAQPITYLIPSATLPPNSVSAYTYATNTAVFHNGKIGYVGYDGSTGNHLDWTLTTEETIRATRTSIPTSEIEVRDSTTGVLRQNGSNLVFPPTAPGSTGSLTHRISCLGFLNLHGIKVSLESGNISEFAVTQLPAATLAPGSDTVYSLQFRPTSIGSKSVTIRIESTATNAPHYRLNFTGSTIAGPPDISVLHGTSGALLPSGSSTFSLGSSPVLVSRIGSLSIRNVGESPLSGITASLHGLHASEFTLSSSSLSQINPGANTPLSITFRPTTLGARSAMVRILSNDPDTPIYEIALTGTGTLPPAEIAIETFNGNNIADGSGTFSFPSVPLGQSSLQEFRIRNVGATNQDLTISGISITGIHSADYSIVATPTSPIAGNGSTLFTIKFEPKATGQRNAFVAIQNNDSNENPFNFSLSGVGIILSPEIGVQLDSSQLTDGSSTVNFGAMGVGSSVKRTLVVRNAGSGPLNITSATISGSAASDFRILQQLPQTLQSNTVATLVIEFTPVSLGLRQSTLAIASDDADENPFDITLSGTGVTPVPKISVLNGNLQLTDGASSFQVAEAVVGLFAESSLTITNTGTGPLTGIVAAIPGPQNGDFRVLQQPAQSLKPAESTTLIIRFSPLASGTRTGALSIASNDQTQNPFDVALTGLGIEARPAIRVSSMGTGTVLVDGVSVLNYGNSATPWTTYEGLYVANIGNVPVTIFEPRIDGTNATDFAIDRDDVSFPLQLPMNSVLHIPIRFDPAEIGLKTALVHFRSNSPQTTSLDVALRGTRPTDAVESNITAAAQGWYNSFGNHAPSNKNFLTGYDNSGVELRSFFGFNTPFLPEDHAFTAASLRIPLPTGGYFGTAASESLQIAEVITPANVITGGSGGTPAFVDLQDGRIFGGPTAVSALDAPGAVVVPLNQEFQTYLTENQGETFILGGSLTTLKRPFSGPEALFGFTDSSTRPTLSITTTRLFGYLLLRDALGGRITQNATLNFGSVSSKSMILTIQNTGNSAINVSQIRFFGTDASDFSANLPTPFTLMPGNSQLATVSFIPSSLGIRKANLQISSDASHSRTFSAALVANAISPARAAFDAWLPDSLADATPEGINHHDGITNLVKFAFGLDPLRPDASQLSSRTAITGLPLVAMSLRPSGGSVAIIFHRRRDQSVLYTPVKSNNLTNGNWSPLSTAATPTSIHFVDETWERVVFEEPIDATSTRWFYKVEVTLR